MYLCIFLILNTVKIRTDLKGELNVSCYQLFLFFSLVPI